ncbi:phosphoribosylglycinamide formyltransferase 1 [Spiroplasma corruscae]|uniref:Phosphoribosylglycinamide formyltransferase n=1 Tax=Spiroplasma corruscae TaxID=216934 RepID=A0A222ER10_9MOLU|nr:phosphoribosylglycinamide formyltransferase [Spiroplasma corruscae]ASP28674.1 phosphoribosylglycinamide formyltransferase 1 [Spiroplasma corruscae]
MINIAIFASGNGSNFQSIVDAYKNNKLLVRKIILVANKENINAIKIANQNKIKNYTFILKNYSSKVSYEEEILKVLEEEKIKYIFLAGYMMLISSVLLERYRNRIFNIHPSLLPSFKGKNAIEETLSYGTYLSGFTIHHVNQDVDSGKIIFQKQVRVYKNDTPEKLQFRIQKQEHKYYWKVINKIIRGDEE